MEEDDVVPRAALRAEARRMVTAAGHRRLLAPRCRVGRPGGEAVSLPGDVDTADPGLMADLVERALDGVRRPGPDGSVGPDSPVLAWVTRSGELVAGDTDLAWLRAARTAFARHGWILPAFLVIGRHGYVDLLGGTGHRWSRVRSSPTTGRRGGPGPG